MDPGESDVIAHLLEEVRLGRLTSRCAWCGRYRAGQQWVHLSERPPFVDELALSHGICPDCIVELRRQGMSV